MSTSIAERAKTPSVDPPLELDANCDLRAADGPVRTLGSYAVLLRAVAQPWGDQVLLRARGCRRCRVGSAIPYGWSTNAVSRPIAFKRLGARDSPHQRPAESERLPREADPNTHTKLGRGDWPTSNGPCQRMRTRFPPRTTPRRCIPDHRGRRSARSRRGAAPSGLADRHLARNAGAGSGKPTDQLPGLRQLNAVAVAAGWRNDDGGEFLTPLYG